MQILGSEFVTNFRFGFLRASLLFICCSLYRVFEQQVGGAFVLTLLSDKEPKVFKTQP